jgi:hypothetical protein
MNEKKQKIVTSFLLLLPSAFYLIAAAVDARPIPQPREIVQSSSSNGYANTLHLINNERRNRQRFLASFYESSTFMELHAHFFSFETKKLQALEETLWKIKKLVKQREFGARGIKFDVVFSSKKDNDHIFSVFVLEASLIATK